MKTVIKNRFYNFWTNENKNNAKYSFYNICKKKIIIC